MSTLLLVLALSILPTRGAAAESSPAHSGRFELRVQLMSGYGAEQAKAVRILRRLSERYPSLLDAKVVAGVRFQIVKEKANQSFDQQSRSLVIDPSELFSPWAAPGFYRGGSASEPEAILFHELLHAWSYAHPGLEDDYQSRVSEGRQEKFIAGANEGHRPAKEHRERVRDALLRIRIGTMTREEYGSLPGPPGQTTKERNLADHDRVIKMPLAEAESIVSTFQAEAEAGTGMLARLLGVESKGRTRELVDKDISEIRVKEPARFEAARKEYERWVRENSTESRLIAQGRRTETALALRYMVPGRRADDHHAGDSPSEWFAYGGEIAAYAAAAERLLTNAEREFWKKELESMRTPR